MEGGRLRQRINRYTIRWQSKGIFLFPLGLTDVHKPYYEAGMGIENIFKIIRIDAIWRLSYLNNPNIEKFGIRAGLQIIF